MRGSVPGQRGRVLRSARWAPVGDLRQFRPELAAATALQQPGALGDQQRAVEYAEEEQERLR